MTERYLVTGAMGCIGAWVVRNLVRSGLSVSTFDLSEDRHRLDLIMEPDEIAQVEFIQGDITDTEAVLAAFERSGASHIIHLAALQVPFCRADPPLGAAVNVVGTVNVFEAARKLGLRHLVYASSLAVYGDKEEYANELLQHDAQHNPHTLYGVYKQANEGTARVYWRDYDLPSIGLRPYTVYGPARDQGMTSEPTKAMLAAARGQGYHIAFGGKNGFQFVDDIARIFIRCAQLDFEGTEAFNIRGAVAGMDEMVAAIEAAAPEAAGKITFAETPLPFPDGQDDSELRKLLGRIPDTPLADGVARTIADFRAAMQQGRL